jgi:hypothetical protein
MSLPFSRSLRSLDSDRFLVARIGLLFSGLMVAALLIWFFLGKVSVYENSSELEFISEGTISGQFSPESIARLRPGQEGRLRLAGGEQDGLPVSPVYVFRIDRESGRVELLIGNLAVTNQLVEGKVEGLVEIVVARIAPVDLVLQSGLSGNSANRPAAGER